MPPHTVYTIGSYWGHALQFWFLVAVGLLLGFVVYALLVYPRLRNIRFRQYRALSRRAGLAAGLSILFLISGSAYWANWRSFFVLELSPTALRLTYRFPTRTFEIPAERVGTITEQLTIDKTDHRLLLIYDADGARHAGAPMRPDDLARVREELAKWKAGAAASSR